MTSKQELSPRLHELNQMADSALNRLGPDVILSEMRERFLAGRVASMNGDIEDALCKHGRPYIFRPKPKGIRKGRVSLCFMNAFNAAEGQHGVYVEGFALLGDRLIHHAWITPDSQSAVEVTWDRKTRAHYFGIPFDDELRNILANRIEHFGIMREDGRLPIWEVVRYLDQRSLLPSKS